MERKEKEEEKKKTMEMNLVKRHGGATPLLWLTVDKEELKEKRNDNEDLCKWRLKEMLRKGEETTIKEERGKGDDKL